jgi:hypothetical protein
MTDHALPRKIGIPHRRKRITTASNRQRTKGLNGSFSRSGLKITAGRPTPHIITTLPTVGLLL